VKIENYPLLEAERVRGVAIYRTMEPAPLHYRVVITAFIQGAYRIPAVVAIANERNIRFGTAPIEFGILAPGQGKVTEWMDDLPPFRDRDVIRSNPDFVEFNHES
jgi:hypothetical protein